LHPISETMIEMVCKNVDLPVIVGGGIKTIAQLDAAYEAGATMAVIETAFEENVILSFSK